MFTAKRAELFEFDAIGMLLLVLVGRVVTTSTSGAFKFDKFSHSPLPSLTQT